MSEARIDEGLFRGQFGGDAGTLGAVFRRLRAEGGTQDPHLGLYGATVSLPGEEGTWRFLDFGEHLQAVLTDCTYARPRRERVRGENRVELHFLLAGPVRLTLPEGDDASAPPVSLVACHPAPGMEYEVCCQSGRYRLLSIYADPALLRESFGMPCDAPLLRPEAGTMQVREDRIEPDALPLLDALFAFDPARRTDLPLAAARVLELTAKAAQRLSRPAEARADQLVLTPRDLAMLDRARALLDASQDAAPTIPALARTLGTNATKLKSGFRCSTVPRSSPIVTTAGWSGRCNCW